LQHRLYQWWKDRVDDPWVKLRDTLTKRPWPYYTLTELEKLADLLLHKEERSVLKEISTRPAKHVRMSQHAYWCFERTALSLAKMRHTAAIPGQTAFVFANFPGSEPDTSRQPQGEVVLVFPYDLRILRQNGLTYYASPGDELVMKASELRHASLVRGQERIAFLKLARSLAPWVLAGTPREVQMEIPQEGGLV
jgi:hypothetical protein